MSTLNRALPLLRTSIRCITTAPRNTIPNTVCPKETAFFKTLAPTWWDDNSVVKLLRYMTPVRVELLKENLINAGLVHSEEVDPQRPFENIKVLEVGCGGGFLAEAIAKLGAHVTGIDANDDLIRVAKEHMLKDETLKKNLTYKTVTVEEFALENAERFDVIVSSEVIEHVLDKEVFASNALKCLRPGGSAFFTTMNRTPISGFYYIYLCENVMKLIPKGAHEYAKFMRPKEMVDLFRKYKCITTNIEGFTLNPITGNWFRVGHPHFNFALHAIKHTTV
ncbi:ubiquinone biosynthesis O-methyltransferase-like [Atheta coriaria]|uniref:ubiquinone biosynthesis O-methyltransferase-like n=1 Tax=Dalotia coriaria TaxID=877792 RepID=UPI0031F3B33F